MEDTDNLWRKHVVKDFKVAKLPSELTWRELYRVRRLAGWGEKWGEAFAMPSAGANGRERAETEEPYCPHQGQ